MMEQVLRLGYSPCPNDTFIFAALAQGRIGVEPYRFDISLADVEVLNQRARMQVPDATKVSVYAVLHLLEHYALVRSGGAIGRGCGPLIVARHPVSMQELRDKPLAIPGKMTTAHLLLQLQGEHHGPRIEMPFEQIMPAVASGKVAGGVIIHEGRFTYPALGLCQVLDLGAWWEAATGLPLPLGGILVKRQLGPKTAQFVEEKIRESLIHAREHPEDAWPYVRSHAQEMDAGVIQQHIDTFVNEFTFDAGEEGEAATRYLLEVAARQEGSVLASNPVFWDRL